MLLQHSQVNTSSVNRESRSIANITSASSIDSVSVFRNSIFVLIMYKRSKKTNQQTNIFHVRLHTYLIICIKHILDQSVH